MSIEIKKVKLSKADLLHVEFKKINPDDNGKATVSEDPDWKVHDDVKKALNELRVHLGMLTGYIKHSDVKDPKAYGKDVDTFIVTGYSIGGDDDDQGIIITGRKILPNKKVVILNNPFERFNQDEATRYKHMDELIKIVEWIRDEAIKYLGGKKWEDPQGELFEKGTDTKKDKKEALK